MIGKISKNIAEKFGAVFSYAPYSFKKQISSLPYYKIRNSKINWLFFIFFNSMLKYLNKPIIVKRKFWDYILELDLRSYVNRQSFFLDFRSGARHDLQVLVSNLLTKKDIYVDVGANIGSTVLIASKKVKKVIAFEPIEEVLHYFNRNMKINNTNNVVLYEFALSNKKGDKKIKISKSNDGSHTLNSGFGELFGGVYEEERIIKTEKFDNLKINKPTMIKIDVEGHELEVLEGMSKSIKKAQYVVCETTPLNYDALQNFFKLHNFEQIKEYGNKKPGIMDLLFINKKKVKDVEKVREICNKYIGRRF